MLTGKSAIIRSTSESVGIASRSPPRLRCHAERSAIRRWKMGCAPGRRTARAPAYSLGYGGRGNPEPIAETERTGGVIFLSTMRIQQVAPIVEFPEDAGTR